MFWIKNTNISYNPANPSFFHIKVGFHGRIQRGGQGVRPPPPPHPIHTHTPGIARLLIFAMLTFSVRRSDPFWEFGPPSEKIFWIRAWVYGGIHFTDMFPGEKVPVGTVPEAQYHTANSSAVFSLKNKAKAAPVAERLRALFLNHSIISPLCLVRVRAPLWSHVRQAKCCL